jgi:DNA-binding MarR family transcriptional regulator
MLRRRRRESAIADPDGDARRIIDAIRRIVRVLRESSRAAEESLGLSGAQLFVLQQVGRRRKVSVGELAQRTLTHQSTVSVVVKHLATRGFLARVRSPADRRRVEVTLTERGRACLRKAPQAAQERLFAGIAAMPATRRHVLAFALDELLDEMGIAKEQPDMFFERRPRGR